MNKQRLVNLCSRSWALTALHLMARGESGRISPLAAAAGCGRNSMSASVEHLVVLGLLEKIQVMVIRFALNIDLRNEALILQNGLWNLIRLLNLMKKKHLYVTSGLCL